MEQFRAAPLRARAAFIAIGAALCVFFVCSVSSVRALAAPAAPAAKTPLDSTLRTGGQGETAPTVFEDMGVVQRRAMAKGGRFLLSTFGSFDLSDGPYTMYSLNVNPGYAISDFLEIYANIAPKFIVNERSIVSKVSSLELAHGERAHITAALPKRQFGVEVLWAPAYGKDSLGARTVIRSDTFLKLSVGRIQYDIDNGNRIALGIGKTYFLGKYLGFRAVINGGYLQTIVENVKSYQTMALIEAGIVGYF